MHLAAFPRSKVPLHLGSKDSALQGRLKTGQIELEMPGIQPAAGLSGGGLTDPDGIERVVSFTTGC